MLRRSVFRAFTALAVTGALALAGGSAAKAQDNFYEGKQIRMIIGYGAGGGYDIYARLITQYMSKYIPGNPTFVHENLPGAATAIAANYLYNQAPQDGTVMGLVSGQLPLSSLMKEPGLEFDPNKFSWIGNPDMANRITFVMADTGIRTIEDLKANSEKLFCGGPGVTTQSIIFPRMMNNLLGINMNVIPGYPDGNAVSLAMERGEVNCRAGNSWAGLRSSDPEFVENRLVNVLVQWGTKDNPEVLDYMGGDVPLAIEFARNELDKKAINLLMSSVIVGRPFLAPPNVPEDRLAVLRGAFDKTMQDPEFLAEAQRLQLDINPLDGQGLADFVKELLGYDQAVIDHASTLTAE